MSLHISLELLPLPNILKREKKLKYGANEGAMVIFSYYLICEPKGETNYISIKKKYFPEK
jgi:hypothetical protein